MGNSTSNEEINHNSNLNVIVETALTNIKNSSEKDKLIDKLFFDTGVKQYRNTLPILPSKTVLIGNDVITKALNLINEKIKENEIVINIFLDHYYYNDFGSRNAKFINIVVITSMSNIYILNGKYVDLIYTGELTSIYDDTPVATIKKYNTILQPEFIKLIQNIHYYNTNFVLNLQSYNWEDKNKNLMMSYQIIMKVVYLLIELNKQHNFNKKKLYVLLLEENKYYIGTTERKIEDRVNEHFANNGSQWTKKYKPIKIVETVENIDQYDEDKYTKMYMDKYGRDNVRGGSYCQLILTKEQNTVLDKEHCTSNNKCFYCKEVHQGKKCSVRYCKHCQKPLPIELEDWKTYHPQCYNTKNDNKLENQGKKWSKAEETMLESLYKKGLTIPELAIKFGRTEGAIKARLEKLGL